MIPDLTGLNIPQVEIEPSCPKCGGDEVKHLGKLGNLRRRKCRNTKCGHRFWTIGYHASDIEYLQIKPSNS